MIRHVGLFFSTLAMGCCAFAQTCEPTPETHAVRILGTDPGGGLSSRTFPEVFGEKSFYQRLDNGWVFALARSENGWSVRLFETEPVGDAPDLSALTPPFRGSPNPRDIEGWHFRNADNTAPNSGEVNAPQKMRAFVISPGLAGTAGLRPPAEPGEPSPSDGIGWLKILDYGLANPVPGGKARMNYLKFDACLSWPREEGETAMLRDETSIEFVSEDIQTFGTCGLSTGSHALSAVFAPRLLGGDIDGDGSLDEVAQVVRSIDGRRGLALCRAGTWLDMIDFGNTPLEGLRSGFVGQTEAWQWVGQNTELPRHLTGYDMPEADGDYLILERIEKEAVVLYWREGALKAERVYGHVEP